MTDNQEQAERRQRLERLLRQYKRNLHNLNMRAANFSPTHIPLDLVNEIDAENERIRDTEQVLASYYTLPPAPVLTQPQQYVSDQLEADYEEEDQTYEQSYQPASSFLSNLREESPVIYWGAAIAAPIVVLAILCSIVNSITYNNSIRLQEDFLPQTGLSDWRGAGVSTVNQGREAVVTNSTSPTTTATLTANTNGAAALDTQPASMLYHRIAYTSANTKFTATVWCKAPQGITCIAFLGDSKTGLSRKLPNNDQTNRRAGTGKWESLKVDLIVGNTSQDVYLFLYAEGAEGVVLFDDVLVREV